MMFNRSYYLRRVVLPPDEFDESDNGIELYIRIPTALAPELFPDQEAILTILDQYYEADGYLMIDDITELADGRIYVEVFGITSNISLLVTAKCEYDGSEEIIGMITPYGEFALGFISGNEMVFPTLDDGIREALDLKPSKEVTVAHNQFLESIDCPDCNEYVYIPQALYTI